MDSGFTYTLRDKNSYDQLDNQVKPVLKPSSANRESLEVYGETLSDLDLGDLSVQCPLKIVSVGTFKLYWILIC